MIDRIDLLMYMYKLDKIMNRVTPLSPQVRSDASVTIHLCDDRKGMDACD